MEAINYGKELFDLAKMAMNLRAEGVIPYEKPDPCDGCDFEYDSNYSVCCNVPMKHHDICSKCGEHSNSICDECEYKR